MPADDKDDDQTKSFTVLTSGLIISQYRIVSKIGAGGMGDVYLAEDTELNRKVALKFVSQHLCQDEDCLARFKREAQAAAALKHPNIITIHEISEYQGRPFMVMEYVDGRSLHEKIKKDTLTIDETIALTIQICAGLHEAHEAGVVHRDIKPSNILLDKNNQPIILDFGLAAIKGSDRITKTGTALGTLGYTSPEQIRGEKVDRRSDLFSLGVVLYELITGRPPFEGDHAAALLYNIVSETPHELSQLCANVPDALQETIAKLLAKDPAQRYQNAEELADDLNKILREISGYERHQRRGGRNLPIQRKRLRKAFLPASVLTVIILLFLIFKPFRFEIGPRQDAEAGVESLAILHFQNLKDRNDSERLGQIIQELVITDLSELSSIRVVSSQRLFDVQKEMGYKDRTRVDPEIAIKVARTAGARKLLSGSLTELQGKWIMTCQLIDVSDGLVIKSHKIDGMDLYDMVDDLAGQVREDLSLSADVADGIGIAVREKTTPSIDAYRHYLDGIDYLNIGSMDSAVASFRKAIEIDHGFNQAYYKLAFAQWWARDITSQQGIESITRILEDKRYATDRERRLAEGALAMFESRFTDAVKMYEQMTRDYPDDKEIYFALGLAYSYESEINKNQALAAFRKVIELDFTYVLAHQEIYDLYIRNRDYFKAMEQARNIITINPDGLMGYRFMVGAALSKGDTNQINLVLAEALKKHKTEEELKGLYLYMSQIGNRIRDQALSEEYARKALELDSSDWLGWALLGDALSNQNVLSEAKRAFEKGLRLNPDNTWCLGGLWYLVIAERDYNKATEIAKRLVEMRPQSPRRYGELYQSYSLARESEAADSVIEAALQAIPSMSGKAQFMKHIAYFNINTFTNIRKAEQYFLKAEAMEMAGASDLSMLDADVLKGLSEVYITTREYDKAEYYADKALERDSLNYFAMRLKFCSCLYRGLYEDAFAEAYRHVRLLPGNVSAYENLIEVLIVTGQYEKADSVMDVAIQSDPMASAKANILSLAAEYYINIGELNRAEQLCLRSMDYSAESWRINELLGRIYELQGNYEKAEDLYINLFKLRKGRRFEPDPLPEHLRIGQLYIRKKDYVKAEEWIRRSLEIDKHNSDVLRSYAQIRCAQGQFDRARQYAAKALHYDSTFFNFAFLSWILVEGDLDIDQGIRLAFQAMDHPPHDDPFDTYIWAEPSLPLPQHTLGSAYLKTKEYGKALEYLKEAAALRPENSVIADKLSLVNRLLGSGA